MSVLSADSIKKVDNRKLGKFSRKRFAWSCLCGSIVNLVPIMTPKFLTCSPGVITMDPTYDSRFTGSGTLVEQHSGGCGMRDVRYLGVANQCLKIVMF